MCNEDRLLNRSGDTPGTGIDSLSSSDAELLEFISTDLFMKKLREEMKDVSDEDFAMVVAGVKSSLSPESEDDPESLCLYCEELVEECVCEDESE